MSLRIYNLPEELPDGCWYDDRGAICMPLTYKQDAILIAMLAACLLIDVAIFVGAFNGNVACIAIASFMATVWIMTIGWLTKSLIADFIEERRSKEGA